MDVYLSFLLVFSFSVNRFKENSVDASITRAQAQQPDTWFSVPNQVFTYKFVGVGGYQYSRLACTIFCGVFGAMAEVSAQADPRDFMRPYIPDPMASFDPLWVNNTNDATDACYVLFDNSSSLVLRAERCSTNATCLCQRTEPVTTTLSASTTSQRTPSFYVPLSTMNKITTIPQSSTSQPHRTSSSPPPTSSTVPTSVSSASLAPMSSALLASMSSASSAPMSPVSRVPAVQITNYSLERFASTTSNEIPCPLHPVSVYGKAKVCYGMKKIN